jgi:hypothetical protein
MLRGRPRKLFNTIFHQGRRLAEMGADMITITWPASSTQTAGG